MFQQVKLGERRGFCKDFHDAGVNTRQSMVHVKDSKTGTTGSTIQLTANFFRLLSRPQWVLYQYHLDYNPPMESWRLRSALLYKHKDALGSAWIVDRALLFLPHKLDSKETVLYSETRNGEKVQVTVTLTDELPPASPVCIQVYNIIFRRILKILNLQQVGHNYYNPNDTLNIPEHRLNIWPGYSTTILQYESFVMLCTDVSYRVLRSESVLDFMDNLRQQYGNERFPQICAAELIGLIVLTKYNNRTYRIDDIAWDHTPNNTFTKGDTDISFKNYYKTRYGLDISDAKQVLLISHMKRKVPAGVPPPGPAMLIPEFCYLTGLTDRMRADSCIMKELNTHTRLSPEQRDRRLKRFVTDIKKSVNAQLELDKWGLSFDEKLLKVTGRVLPGEKIFQGSRSYEYNPRAANWFKKMLGVRLINAPPLDNWLMLYTRRNCNEAHSLLQTLYEVSIPFGIRVQRPTMIEYEDRQESLLRALHDYVGPQTQMVMVVLPDTRKDKYDSIKKYLCVDCPTPSQCVVSHSLRRPQELKTVVTNIALQMACKMGGELWSVEIPIWSWMHKGLDEQMYIQSAKGFFSLAIFNLSAFGGFMHGYVRQLKRLMVVGIDCYHDSVAGKRSIGALVASLNQTMSRWFSKSVLQYQGQEIMDGLKNALSAALTDYLKFNNCLPSHIIVYRDGVRDGQLHSVVNHEVAQIIESITSMGQDYMPKLSVVVVNKHISCRFFAYINGKVTNPPPGTVIDSEVTHPEWYDFYIVSQVCCTGSVSPTHYNVVYDTSGLKPDHMQRLTYKLCHMYYNVQGIIPVPAPCQYAHKLAFLVAKSIHREHHAHLDNVLFYL